MESWNDEREVREMTAVFRKKGVEEWKVGIMNESWPSAAPFTGLSAQR